MPTTETVEKTSYDRLIAALHVQWESHGAAAMSARQISGVAGSPVSSIYHHFESLEHLFLASQHQCLTDAAQWCAAQLVECEGFPATGEGFAGFFAHVVDGWCEDRRALAFAWRECQLLAQKGAFFQDAARGWSALWHGFWQAACARFGVTGGTLTAQRVFANESFLHMIRWRRLADRAALDETARTLAAWLTATPLPPAPWREYAREEAMRAMPELPERDAAAMRIVEAAAKVIDEDGFASLTHRAVAQAAGLTLGTVSHKFRTKPALAGAAFEGLYRASVEKLHPNTPANPLTLADAARDMAGLIARRAAARGSDELFLATARDPGLAHFGAQLRYLRGRTSRAMLEALLDDGRPVTVSEAALLSSYLAALLRAYAAMPQDDAERRVHAELTTLLTQIASARVG